MCLTSLITDYGPLPSRVERGVALLDKHFPGWANGIPVDMNMLENGNCAACHTTGEKRFITACMVIQALAGEGSDEFDNAFALEHGFDVTNLEKATTARAGELQALWRAAIAARRENDAQG